MNNNLEQGGHWLKKPGIIKELKISEFGEKIGEPNIKMKLTAVLICSIVCYFIVFSYIISFLKKIDGKSTLNAI